MAMPGRLAELHSDVRSMVATLDKRRFRLEKNPTSATGYINVIKVKGKYQARLQVPGEGRGGQIKRKQCSLPTTFDEAEDAALYLAWVESQDHSDWENGRPPKLTVRKPRTKQPARPAQQADAAVPCAEARSKYGTSHDRMAVPINFPMPHAPFVAASPLPMPPLGYVAPFRFPM